MQTHDLMWNESSLIVGFYERFPIDDKLLKHANASFAQVPGFISIKYRYRLSNTVLVTVQWDKLGIFKDEVTRLNFVEYCEHNFMLTPCSFHERVPTQMTCSRWSCQTARDVHGIANDPNAGVGVTIAIIDSGLSPHPYLPATSFTQALQSEELWPEYLKSSIATWHIDLMAKFESQHSIWDAPSYNVQSQTYPYQVKSPSDFRSDTADQVDLLTEELDAIWEDNFRKWKDDKKYKGTINEAKNLPVLPLHRLSPLGQLRRISTLSHNFVDDNLRIDDLVGHGTQMTGLLAARPISYQENDAKKRSSFEKYEPDVLGLVPNAEIMVLKCYDSLKIQESNVDAMIRALEYAADKNADIVYVGLTFFAGSRSQAIIPPTAAITLAKTIMELRKKDIAVVCPAGNGYGRLGSPGLSFPAGGPAGAVAITAVELDENGEITFAEYSNYASSYDRVSFTAFGGNESDSVLTTSLDYGYARVHGSSVAAAIATGLMAKYMSRVYLATVHNQYEERVSAAVRAGHLPSVRNIIASPQKIKIDDLLTEAEHRAKTSFFSNHPDPERRFGKGLIRQFLP